jgi:membrane-associated phospholipid phosphatase
LAALLISLHLPRIEVATNWQLAKNRRLPWGYRCAQVVDAEELRMPNCHRAEPLAKRAPSARGEAIWRWLTMTGLLMLAAGAALPLDLATARWSLQERCPDFLRELFAACEAFGNGIGVAIILIAVWLLDAKGRARMPRLVCAVLSGALTADLVKLLIARTRPRDFVITGQQIADSFTSWLPFGDTQASGQSFPSAHTATGVALTLALAWAYPRGRWLFVALGVMVGLQRIESGAHFASDVVMGAAVGWLGAQAMLIPGACWGFFDRLEVGRPIATNGGHPPAQTANQARRAA